MAIIILIVSIPTIIIFSFLNHPSFGKLPSGERLEKIKLSTNYRDDRFHNITYTPDLPEDVGYYDVFKKFFFGETFRTEPIDTIPSIKTNLLTQDLAEDIIIWFGHSSYFIQIDKKRILVDPVFSSSISPLPFGMKSFKGTDIYNTDDIPEIDYLFISHDHWDHLDYETIKKLKPKIKKVICGLGVGEHFEYWGYSKNSIIEKDWNESIELDSGFSVHTTPARHFSGRGLSRNKSLWLSFVLKTPTMKFFIGGDSGYDTHFQEIGEKFGPFDLAIIENGQYNYMWRYIHSMPDQTIKIAKEINAKKILPVHSSKFRLALHQWDEPLELITKNNTDNLNIITPIIGEKINLKDDNQIFIKWWECIN